MTRRKSIRRDKRIAIRLTSSELDFIESLGEVLNIGSKSEVVREIMFSFKIILDTPLKDLIREKAKELDPTDMQELPLKYLIKPILQIIAEKSSRTQRSGELPS